MFEGLLQPTHLVVLLVVGLLVLGPKRLPEVGRALGGGLKSFKAGLTEDDDRPAVREATADAAPAEAPVAVAAERA